ncbi:SGNH/GDSL hydrolase family protein [soil metagenome]
MNRVWIGRATMQRRWWWVALTVVAVVAATALQFSQNHAGQASSSPTGSAGRTVLLIGDSYTEGSSTPDQSYGCLTAAELGWTCDIATQPGTGYLNGGPGHRFQLGGNTESTTSFAERLPALREMYRPDFVILDGGRNDLQYDTGELLRTLTDTVTETIDCWPNSHIVVIAPWFLNEPVIRPPALGGRTIGEQFRSALDSLPAGENVDLIDPAALGWFVDMDVAPYLSDDGIHPDVDGVERISRLLTAALITEAGVSPS